MSTEVDPNNTGEQASSSPKKRVKPNNIPKLDNEAIDARRKEAIDSLPAAVQKKPQLYNDVVEIINKTNLHRNWSESNLYKGFMHWSEFAESNDRPKLAYMIATGAVYKALKGNVPKFLLEVEKRGLKEWMAEQLEIPAQKATSSTATPQVKTEPGTQSANLNTIRQSIEGENGSTPLAGSKRPALAESSEPASKRPNFGTNQAHGTPKSTVEILQLPQQRIVFREAGTQTDQTLAIEEAAKEMRMTTAENKERGKKMDEQYEMLRDLTGMLNNYRASGSSQLTQTRPAINSVQQQAFQLPAQEVFSVQPGTFQSGTFPHGGRGGPTFFYNPNREWQ
ncbi:hypothetical protein NW752_009276 [Fusarium irregulare]|uniref:Uncharacterized protein n=1 Tax=Fusarium irregulare TaxID=2494466 RepID=A0A9W8U7T8_9HYPO|nr:hypothetical protein NW766_008810 [Fusarium irregulare]KAJ4010098.1 hypothetical protein NW752_009276 [Fusarium irregulare]